MKRFVVIGSESTGKSTLSQQLAKHYQTAWVPEFARGYLEQIDRPYEEEDLLEIAKGQLALEDDKATSADKLLICDTDLYVIKVWSESKYGDCHPQILQWISERRYDGYLLTYIDIPWTYDPQREHPEPAAREYFYNIYKDIVVNCGIPWADIRGGEQERLSNAINFIDRLL